MDWACSANAADTPGGWLSTPDADTIAELRRGDEAIFVALIDRYHRALLRVAMLYVADQSVAEELVQETWLGLLQRLERFDDRCSLKTWIFRRNKARCGRMVDLTRGVYSDYLYVHNCASGKPAVERRRS